MIESVSRDRLTALEMASVAVLAVSIRRTAADVRRNAGIRSALAISQKLPARLPCATNRLRRISRPYRSPHGVGKMSAPFWLVKPKEENG